MGHTLRYRYPFVSSKVDHTYRKRMDVDTDLLALQARFINCSRETVADYHLL